MFSIIFWKWKWFVLKTSFTIETFLIIALYKSLDKCLYRKKVSSYFKLTYFMLKCQTQSAVQLYTAWTYFIQTLPKLWLLIINERSTVSTKSLFKKFRVSFWRTQFTNLRTLYYKLLWSNMLLPDLSYFPSQTLVIFQMCEDKSLCNKIFTFPILNLK